METWLFRAAALLSLAVLARAAAAPVTDEPPVLTKPGTAIMPRQQFEAINDAYKRAWTAWFETFSKATTDDERVRVRLELAPPPVHFTGPWLDLARRYPKAPVSLDALLRVLSDSTSPAKIREAIDLLMRDHLRDPSILTVVDRLGVQSLATEDVLRTLAEQGGDPALRGRACRALARHLKRLADAARHARRSPRFAAFIRYTTPGEVSAALLARDPNDLVREAEAQFALASQRFGREKDGRATIAEAVEAELFELRHLREGVAAPEIEGIGIDGKPMRLSDYRGKVVALVFWDNWCGPCGASSRPSGRWPSGSGAGRSPCWASTAMKTARR